MMSSVATANSASFGHGNNQSMLELFTMPGKFRHRRLDKQTHTHTVHHYHIHHQTPVLSDAKSI